MTPRSRQKRRHPAAPVDEPMMDINTTPLIDVMLVLLIMLIITIPVQLDAVKLNLPTGTPPAAPPSPPTVLRIDVDAGSRIVWNGEALQAADELAARMQALAQQPEPPELHVRPDAAADYAVVANVLVTAQRQGLTKVGIVGSEQFAP